SGVRATRATAVALAALRSATVAALPAFAGRSAAPGGTGIPGSAGSPARRRTALAVRPALPARAAGGFATLTRLGLLFAPAVFGRVAAAMESENRYEGDQRHE